MVFGIRLLPIFCFFVWSRILLTCLSGPVYLLMAGLLGRRLCWFAVLGVVLADRRGWVLGRLLALRLRLLGCSRLWTLVCLRAWLI